MKGYSYLLWAYNIIWLGIAGYLVFIFFRLKKVSDRLERLESRLAGDRPSGPGAS